MENDLGIEIITFASQSPLFKGLSLTILGILALLFAFWLNKKTEPNKVGLWVFAAIAAFILVYGLFILVYQPQWWLPPR